MQWTRAKIIEMGFIALLFVLMVVIAVTSIVVVVNQKNTSQVQEDDSTGELLLVQFLFRHGARTPTHLYPDDPYVNYSWPEGLGGLTIHGKERMYEYGQVLHKRYGKYLQNILVRNIIAQSSPIRRVLDSSQAVLGGLFPPTQSQLWSTALDIAKQWQPIGVSTVEAKRAYLVGDIFECPAADQLSANQNDLPQVKQFLADNHDFLERFSKYSGHDASGSGWGVVSGLQDTFTCEENYFGSDFKWPAWMAQVGANCWQKMTDFRNFGFAISGFLPQKFLRLKAGTFLKEMLSNLNKTINKETIDLENREVYTYGTHDTMLSWILNAIGMFKEQPSFGSGLIIELRNDTKTGVPMVHLMYANVTNNFDIYQLALNESTIFAPLCKESSCDFVNFAASLQSYLPDDIEKECNELSY